MDRLEAWPTGQNELAFDVLTGGVYSDGSSTACSSVGSARRSREPGQV